MSAPLSAAEYSEDLGNGLVRRWSTAADQEKIALCLGAVFRDKADEEPNQHMISRTQIIMQPGFPLMGPGDFALVEDTSKPERPVVACTCCWSHRWSYGGIPFGVGRPEYVATLAEYRNRGLMRGLFEMFHARSAARGELVQAITGIPYYYRQFGYEYVLDLDGRRLVYTAAIPAKKENEPEAYHLRLATLEDVPHLLALYNQGCSSSLVWSEATEADWRYYITLWDDPVLNDQGVTVSALNERLYMIVDQDGQVCGFTGTRPRRHSNTFSAFSIELYTHVNWQAVMPPLLRALYALGQQVQVFGSNVEDVNQLALYLGRSHPAYDVLGQKLAPRGDPAYAWYIRIADVPGFVRHITPVLEQRLAGSILAGHTGETMLDFYRGGLRLQFAQGKLTAAESWQTPPYGEDAAQVGCPSLVFLQLLLGYRSLAELRSIYPDVWAKEDAALLLDILLPKQLSKVWGLGYT